jgi:hypothetical protein
MDAVIVTDGQECGLPKIYGTRKKYSYVRKSKTHHREESSKGSKSL